MILITGASGFIGKHLTKALVEKGIPFRALARSISSQEKMEELGYETVFGDITEELSLEKAFENIDTVIHLVGVINPTKEHTLDEINRIGTRNVVRTAEKSGTKRIIYISSVAASADSNNPYALSTWGAEEEIRTSKKLEKIVVKTAIVYGAGNSFAAKLERLVKALPIFALVPGKGTANFQPIFIEDIIDIMLRLLNQTPENKKLILETGGPEVLDLNSMLNVLSLAIRKKRRIVHIPLWLAKSTAFIVNKLSKNALITSSEIDLLQLDHIANNEALLNIFEDIDLTSFKEGLRKTFY